MTQKEIQRALVVTMGPLAERVGAGIEAWLQAEDAPRPAVTVTHVTEMADLSERLTRGLLAISQTTLRADLLARGWRPDHLHEIGLYLVVDMTQSDPQPEQVATAAAQLAYDRLGMAMAGILLALLPEEQTAEDAAWLAQQAQLLPSFPRGVVALGLANEAGLCLPEENALVSAASRLLQAIISTPLRDGLDWSSSLGEMAGTVMSMGLAEWHWSANRVRDMLVNRWAAAVLSQWRLADRDLATTGQQAQAWMDQAQLSPEALVGRLWERLPAAIATPQWSYPQPWALRQLVENICPEPGDDEVVLTSASEQLGQEARQGLTTAVETLLDERAVGGLSMAQVWLRALSRHLETCQDEVADRQDLITSRQAAASGGRRAVQQALDEMLVGWPQPSLRGWLGAALQPWRWPGLVWQYLRIQQLGDMLAQRCREQAQWQRHGALAQAAQEVYRRLETAVQHASLQVEELDDMVGYLQTLVQEQQEKRPALDDDDLAWLPAASLLAQPAREAELAAQAVGGLGQQLARPDDEATLKGLFATARQRLREVESLTAVDALLGQKANASALAEWWELIGEQAAPLWLFDATQLPDLLRSQRQLSTLVCGQNALRLQERLGLDGESLVRWLESPDPERILVLRVRWGVPAWNREESMEVQNARDSWHAG